MIKKRGLLGIVFILSLLVLSGLVSADSCSIVERNQCQGGDTDYMVFGISDLTNAHGELYDQNNYNYVLCCDFAGSHVCSNENKVLGLYSSTNAHAEIPSLTNYNEEVCFSTLDCVGTTNPENYEDYDLEMFSLSESTNAHIGEYNEQDYSYKVLCKADCGEMGYNCKDGETCEGTIYSNFYCSTAGEVCCDETLGNGTITCSEMDYECVESEETCSGSIFQEYTCPIEGYVCCNGAVGSNETCEELGYQCTTSCNGYILDLTGCARGEDCCSPTIPPTPGNQYWTDYYWEPISSITINETYLGGSGSENTVGIISTEEEPGATYFIEIWEADEDVLYDDPIRTIEQSSALTGTVNQYGNIEEQWAIYQSDITAGGSEDTSEFYFKIITQGETGQTTTPYRNEQLDVTILSSSTPPFGDLITFWTNYNYNEITSIEIPVEYLSGNNDENLVHVGLQEIQLPPGSAAINVEVEIWEKDAGEDDAIRTGANAISHTITGTSGYVPWYITSSDIQNALDENEGENGFEFYYVIKAQGYSYQDSTKILDVMITGEPSDLVDGFWTDWDENIIETITFNSGNLGGNPDKDNTVFMNANNLNNYAGSQATFEIYEFDSLNQDDAIRTIEQGNALTGTVGQDETVDVSWTVTPYDILAAYDGGLDGDPYKFYFKMTIGHQEFIFSDSEDRLNMFIEGENPPEPPEELVAYWTNYSGENLTGPLTFNSSNLGGTASSKNTVKMHVDDWGEQWTNAIVIFEIYEKDSGLFSSDDDIRTIEDNNAIIGYIDSEGNLQADWTVTSEDILNAQNGDADGGDPFEFYFNIVLANWEREFKDEIFELYVSGDTGPPPEGYLELAQGKWRSAPYGTSPITTLNFDPDKTNPQAVAFTWDIGESANGLTYYVEIYEKDGFLNADDEIRTIEQDNALTGIVANTEASALWTITGDDIIKGGDEEYSQFYYKIIIEDEDKTFSDNILEVINETYECVTIDWCKNYDDSGTCNADNCNVSDYTVETNYPEVNCSDPSVSCYCYWDEENNGCEGRWSGGIGPGGIEIGYCDTEENSQGDDCEDGFLSYSWTAKWVWGENNEYDNCGACYADDPDNCTDYCINDTFGKWHYDPNNINEECQSGSNTIACPAQIQLPLGSWFNWVIAVIIILVIYYLIVNSKKKQKPKTKVKSKKK